MLSVFAGARYNYQNVNISIRDNGDERLPLLRELAGLPRNLQASGSIDWVDPGPSGGPDWGIRFVVRPLLTHRRKTGGAFGDIGKIARAV